MLFPCATPSRLSPQRFESTLTAAAPHMHTCNVLQALRGILVLSGQPMTAGQWYQQHTNLHICSQTPLFRWHCTSGVAGGGGLFCKCICCSPDFYFYLLDLLKSISLHLPVCQWVCLTNTRFICLSVCLPVSQSVGVCGFTLFSTASLQLCMGTCNCC